MKCVVLDDLEVLTKWLTMEIDHFGHKVTGLTMCAN